MASEYNVIGKYGVPRRFGETKAAGTAIYTRDVRMPGMLFAKALRSPYAHARIVSMDTSAAEAYPGVRGVLRYDDPEIVESGHAEILNNEAWHEGGPLGAIVAADTLQIAEEAVQLIEVEWEQLPFYLDPEESIADGADILYEEHFPENNQYSTFLSQFVPDKYSRKNPDLDAGFAEADEVIEEKLVYKKMYHAGSEPRCYVFKWDGDLLNVWSHSQTPSTEGPMAQGDRLLIPRMLGIPASQMKVNATFQGGTFGGKISLEHICVAVAILAKNLKAPISFLQSRSDEQGREDAGIVCNLKVGVKNDGTITAIHLDPAIVDVGDSGVEGEGFIWVVVGGAVPNHMLCENLKCENIYADNRYALTSKACATSFRCEKNQTAFIHGKVTHLISERLGMDPTEVALKNAWTATNSLDEVIAAGKAAIDWDNKWHLPGTKQLANGKYHGMGLTWSHMWHAGGGGAQFGSMAASIDFDGSVQLVSMVSDVGVSAHTTYIMIAAEELGVSVDKVNFALNDSDCSYALKSPGGSYGCAANAPLVRMCALGVKEKILNIVAPNFEVTAEELDIKDNMVFVKADPENKQAIASLFSALGCAKFPLTYAIDATIGPGIMEPPYNCFQAHLCEVEVDPETGKVDVTNAVIVNDFGQIMRPESCEGQMYGGYYMAWGRNLTEEVIHDPTTGVRLNDNLCDYKYSLMLDSVFPETVMMEVAKDVGVYGNVGSGEPTATVADALINNAVCNALGVNINQNPVLPGDILKALGKA